MTESRNADSWRSSSARSRRRRLAASMARPARSTSVNRAAMVSTVSRRWFDEANAASVGTSALTVQPSAGTGV